MGLEPREPRQRAGGAEVREPPLKRALPRVLAETTLEDQGEDPDRDENEMVLDVKIPVDPVA